MYNLQWNSWTHDQAKWVTQFGINSLPIAMSLYMGDWWWIVLSEQRDTYTPSFKQPRIYVSIRGLRQVTNVSNRYLPGLVGSNLQPKIHRFWHVFYCFLLGQLVFLSSVWCLVPGSWNTWFITEWWSHKQFLKYFSVNAYILSYKEWKIHLQNSERFFPTALHHCDQSCQD